jgi:hypothetical protein
LALRLYLIIFAQHKMARRPKTPCPNCVHGVKRCERHQRAYNPHAPTRLRIARENAAEAASTSNRPDTNPDITPDSRNKRRKRKRAQKQRVKRATDPSNDHTTNQVADPSSDDSDDDDTHSQPAKRIRLDEQAGSAKKKATPTDSGAQQQPAKSERVKDSTDNSSEDSSDSSSEDSSNSSSEDCSSSSDEDSSEKSSRDSSSNSSKDSFVATSSDDSDDDTPSPPAKRAHLGQVSGSAKDEATPGQDYIPTSTPTIPYNPLLVTIKKRLAELQELVDIALEQSANAPAADTTDGSEKAKRKRERREEKERHEKKERKRGRREQKERDKKIAAEQVEEAEADSSDDDSSNSEDESSTAGRGHDKLFILTTSSKSPKKHRHSS